MRNKLLLVLFVVVFVGCGDWGGKSIPQPESDSSQLSQLPESAHTFGYVHQSIPSVINWQTRELRDMRLEVRELKEQLERIEDKLENLK